MIHGYDDESYEKVPMRTKGDIDEIERDVNVLKSEVSGLASGSPLVANSVSEMTDTSRTYVNITDGNWYYYNGSNWIVGGVYQAAQNSDLLSASLYLKDEYEDISRSENFYNADSKYNKKNVYYTAGGNLVSSSANYKISHPIFVKAGHTYCKTKVGTSYGNNRKIFYVNKDGNFVNGFTYTVNETEGADYDTFVAPIDGYIVLNIHNNISSVDENMLTETNYPNEYIPFKEVKESLGVYSSNIEYDEKIKTDNLSLFVESENLFNVNSKYNQVGKFIGYSAETGEIGIVNAGSLYKVTHPIYLEKNDIVKLYFDKEKYGTNYRYCKINPLTLEFISGRNGTYDSENHIMTATINEPGYYSFNYREEYENTMMVVKNNDYPSEYIPFRCDKYNESKEKETNIEKLQVNELYGKKISFNGDSICANSGGYAKIIGENNNATIQNIAISGATIVSGTQYQDGRDRHWISTSVVNMDEDSDYAILEGGVNDSSQGLTLGTISNGYDDDFDPTSSFCSAFEYMLKQLVTRFKGKKIGYIAVHQMTPNYRNINNPDTSYFYAAKKCCEKWGVPFLDLNTNVPPFRYFEDISSALYELRTTYTKNGDGWHPTEEGYQKYYVPKIEAWLKTL